MGLRYLDRGSRGVHLDRVAFYVLAVLAAAAVATLRFQSLAVGAVAFAGMVATHVVYLGGLFYGLAVG